MATLVQQLPKPRRTHLRAEIDVPVQVINDHASPSSSHAQTPVTRRASAPLPSSRMMSQPYPVSHSCQMLLPGECRGDGNIGFVGGNVFTCGQAPSWTKTANPSALHVPFFAQPQSPSLFSFASAWAAGTLRTSTLYDETPPHALPSPSSELVPPELPPELSRAHRIPLANPDGADGAHDAATPPGALAASHWDAPTVPVEEPLQAERELEGTLPSIGAELSKFETDHIAKEILTVDADMLINTEAHGILAMEKSDRDVLAAAEAKIEELEVELAERRSAASEAQALEAEVAKAATRIQEMEAELGEHRSAAARISALEMQVTEQQSAATRVKALEAEVAEHRSTTVRIHALEAELAEQNCVAARVKDLEAELTEMKAIAADLAGSKVTLEAELAEERSIAKRVLELESQLVEQREIAARVPELVAHVAEQRSAVARAKALEAEVVEYRSAAARIPELEAELVKQREVALQVPELAAVVAEQWSATVRIRELETEVADQRSAAARAQELEAELTVQKEAAAKVKTLEREVIELRSAAARIPKLEAEVAEQRSLRMAAEAALPQEAEREREPEVVPHVVLCASSPRLLGESSQGLRPRDRVLSGLESALTKNVARELFRLEQGIVLDKVAERSCRKQKRLLAVSPEEMQLRWGKDLRQLGKSYSKLDLYEVIRIHYGTMARACVLYPELPPWLCFSVYTTRRSYDFCCRDEEAVQACVLGISCLCEWAAGAVLMGRGRFVALRGWCKLQASCFRRRIPLSRLFLEAASQAAADRPQHLLAMRQ